MAAGIMGRRPTLFTLGRLYEKYFVYLRVSLAILDHDK